MTVVIEIPTWTQDRKRKYQEYLWQEGLLVPLPRSPIPVADRLQPSGLSKRKVSKPSRQVGRSQRGRSTSRAQGPLRPRPRSPRQRATSEQEDVLRDIELDEPERFLSQNRLRSRGKTRAQLLLRKLKNRRRRCISISSDSSTSSGSSSVSSTTSTSTSSSSSDDFIIDDRNSSSNVELPACFSLNSAQSPEYRFKVVFHYLLLLVVCGATISPLRGELAEYFDPQLRHFRRTLSDIRDSRVRSQIWRHGFVQALESRPEFFTTRIEPAREGCDACHQSGRLGPYSISIEGRPYDPDSHIERITGLVTARSGNTKTAGKAIRFTLGTFCKAGAELYHELTHYEHHLYLAVRRQYQDLLDALGVSSRGEAKYPERPSVRNREQSNLRREVLPSDSRDVDAVLMWMDRRGDQQKHYRLYQDLLDRARRFQVGRKAMVD